MQEMMTRNDVGVTFGDQGAINECLLTSSGSREQRQCQTELVAWNWGWYHDHYAGIGTVVSATIGHDGKESKVGVADAYVLYG